MLQDPELKADGEVHVVAEVPNEVTGAEIIDAMQSSSSADEMVTEGARNSLFLNGGSKVFREPDGEISLSGGGFVGQDGDQVI